MIATLATKRNSLLKNADPGWTCPYPTQKKIVGKCFHDRSFSLPLDSSYITLENFGLLEDSFHHIIAGYAYIYIYLCIILHIIYYIYIYIIFI
jgi:hypothetical protein